MEAFPQVLQAVITTVIIFVLFLVLEQLYRAYLSLGKSRIDVYPFTGSSTKVFQQNPQNPSNITLPHSENQLTGIEFSYSLFTYISEDTIDSTSTDGWKTIFYKGYTSSPFPLLGPGVFVSDNVTSNAAVTLRVVMNTYDNWFNTVDVKQIPINKWFHLAIVLRKNTCEVYVNGNLANKKSFNGTLPYQNYQPLNLMPNVKTLSTDFLNASTETTKKRGIPPGENFVIKGKFDGFVSNLTYYSYALSYSEINSAMNVGPSSKFDESSMDKPPYLIDTWWSQRKE
jgi:hypothetical protein